MKRKINALFLCIVPVFCLISCSVSFTFTGANLPLEVKTIFIDNFYNDAVEGPATLGALFSERIRDYYQRNTSLKQVQEGGDLQFEGVITRYDVAPVAAGSSEFQNAELQRLTIVVQLQFTNNYDDEKSFDKSFSQFEDFDANRNLTDVEEELIDEIFERIIFDIFNATVADW